MDRGIRSLINQTALVRPITIEELMDLQGSLPIADVRTPAEFEHGHIPGAFNLPIFSNEERKIVGTAYKQESREAAIMLGFDITGPKWSGFIRQALEKAPQKKIAVHCWRGGMRSGAMAWALDLYGFEVYVLKGGYKHYRRWTARQFETPFFLQVIGGMTGTGKTAILHELSKRGEQVIDLEGIAQHQGSSYGTLNRLVQPTQEQFENELARQLSAIDRERRAWIEDESINIGQCFIPAPLWRQMQAADTVVLELELEQRVSSLAKEYGCLDREFLVACTERIHKRLGPVRTKEAVNAINEGRMEDFVREVLFYYDKAYRKGLGSREPRQLRKLELNGADPAENTSQLLKAFSHEHTGH